MRLKRNQRKKKMSIKTFKEFVTEDSPASDYVAPEQSGDETKELKPQSKGEQQFKDIHKVEVARHPVAGDHMFNGSREEVLK